MPASRATSASTPPKMPSPPVFAMRSVPLRALPSASACITTSSAASSADGGISASAETFAPLGTFADFEAYFDALFAYFADPASWIADVEAAPVLQRLKSDGLKLGVISNFDYRLYRILDGLDLTRHFDSITISSEAGFAKPRREVYDAALARAGVTAHDAMHIGDSEHLDFAPAAALGMGAVLIDREDRNAAPSIAGRTARISSLASVPELAQVFGLS